MIGAALVLAMRSLLPYALAFAAGAMIYVVAEELIPEAKRESNRHSDIPTIGGDAWLRGDDAFGFGFRLKFNGG